MKKVIVLVAVALTTSLTASSCASHEKNCKSLGGVVQSQNVYDEKGNFDHEHFQCITHNGDVVDEWDGK